MGYITTTHLLDHVHPRTLVVNDPFWVRNFPEKLLVLRFPDLIPATAIARDLDALKAFKHAHGDIILKPLYGNGGAGVFRLDPNDRNLSSLHELFMSFSREPLIAQRFLPEVAKGDKRVILVDGEPVGAINRVPAQGETRSNMHVGGRPEKAELTERDREICAADRPDLARKRSGFRGDRRDRRLSDGDQRDLADRHPGARAVRRHQHRRRHLGGDRGAAEGGKLTTSCIFQTPLFKLPANFPRKSATFRSAIARSEIAGRGLRERPATAVTRPAGRAG